MESPASRPFGLSALLCLSLAGCRVDADAAEPVAGSQELCCKQAGDDNVSFVGCRATGHCRNSEPVWVRGPVSCGPVEPEGCEGGRCCTLVVDPTASPADEALADAVAEVADELPDAPPPPERITPVPLDWQATPTPVAIPNYVCPATLERGVTGHVLLHVEVDGAGRVTQVAIRESLDPECDALARDALLHAEFEPALSPTGEPMAASMRWVYSFDAAPEE